MTPVIQAEVHFHQQDQASVFSQSNIADPWNERLAEIGLFSFYSLRMFSKDRYTNADSMAVFAFHSGAFANTMPAILVILGNPCIEQIPKSRRYYSPLESQ